MCSRGIPQISSATDLSEKSPIYYDMPEVYELFSLAEDHPGIVLSFLKDQAQGKDVLEIGCGTGKYTRSLSPFAANYHALDASAAMLEIARAKTLAKETVAFYQAAAEALPFSDSRFDLVFASWVFGTILDESRRMQAVKEALRVLKPGGKLLLVENAIGGEFERIRARWPDSSRTAHYNNWLKEACQMNVVAEFDSFFLFSSLAEAQTVVGRIWGSEAQSRVINQQIEHRICIFCGMKQ